MSRPTLLSEEEQRHRSLSVAHTVRVPSITLGKCQQEFITTLHSSTALKVLGSGDEDKSRKEKEGRKDRGKVWNQSYHQTFSTPPSPPYTHLPPIGPLEQAWWVRGWVVHGPLRVVEVVVGAADFGGRVTQEKGAHRPGGRRNSPSGENFSRMPLRLSHLGFQMRTVGERGAPVTVSCLLRRVSFSAVFGRTKSRFSSADRTRCRTTLRLVLVWCVSMATAVPESQWKGWLYGCICFRLFLCAYLKGVVAAPCSCHARPHSSSI